MRRLVVDVGFDRREHIEQRRGLEQQLVERFVGQQQLVERFVGRQQLVERFVERFVGQQWLVERFVERWRRPARRRRRSDRLVRSVDPYRHDVFAA
jgi:hypothetical protein